MTAAALDRSIGDAHRILLDTSALIAYHSTSEPTHPLARHLMGRIEEDADPLRGYFSVVSAAELLVRPYRQGAPELTLMHTFLASFPNLTLLPVDLAVATQAATLRAVTGVRMPDAMILASALLSGCEAIVSNDGEWKRRMEPLFGQFNWVYLGNFT
jgi:predicted nucleic acid-binding protein